MSAAARRTHPSVASLLFSYLWVSTERMSYRSVLEADQSPVIPPYTTLRAGSPASNSLGIVEFTMDRDAEILKPDLPALLRGYLLVRIGFEGANSRVAAPILHQVAVVRLCDRKRITSSLPDRAC